MVNWSNLLGVFRRGKSEENQVLTVSLVELDGWLRQQQHEIIKNQELEKEAENYLNQLKDVHWKIGARVGEWNKALSKISDKVQRKEIKSILDDTKILLDYVTFSEEVNLPEVIKSHSLLSKEVETLLQNMEKSSFLNNYSLLLGEEETENKTETEMVLDNEVKEGGVNPLFQELLEWSALQGKFEQKLATCGLQKIASLLQRAKQAQLDQEKIKQLHQSLEEKELRLEQSRQKLAEKERELTQMKDAPGFMELFALKEQKEDALAEKNEIQNTITNFFTVIRPALKAYQDAHPNHPEEKLLNKYLFNGQNAFLEDLDLAIVPLLMKIDEAINAQQLSLTVMEMQRCSPQLEKVSKGYLTELKQDYERASRKLIEVRASMNSPDLLLKVEDASYRLDHFKAQVDRLEEEVADDEEELKEREEMQYQSQQFLRDAVKIGFGKEIVIIAETKVTDEVKEEKSISE